MLTGNGAAAWAARLADVDYIAAYPITPQTEIVELLSKWVAEGVLKAKFVEFESEHSMLGAAGAASLTGARVFSATSSQGLAYGFENLFAISGWRAPMVLVNVARGLGMPMTLQVDHTDVMSVRDTGFIQLHAENCQEILDLILIGYRIGEDERVLLPVIVNLDGFFLSFTREPVFIPSEEEVERFLPEYRPPHGIVYSDETLAYAPTILEGHSYSYFRYQLHFACIKAKEVFYEAAVEYEKLTGRKYSPVDKYLLNDADYAIISMNSFSTTIKGAIRKMRKEGYKVGHLKITMFRPFPKNEIVSALKGLKGVIVFDQNLAPGKGGIMYPEIVEALYHVEERPKVILSFIGGLGGKALTYSEIRYMIKRAMEAYESGALPDESILLYTDEDVRRMKRDMEIAGKEWGV